MLSFIPLNLLIANTTPKTFYHIQLDLILHCINKTVYRIALFIFHTKIMREVLLFIIEFITQMTSYVTPV